jgi:hypothetical protein
MDEGSPDWTMSSEDPPPAPIVPHRVRARVRAGGPRHGSRDGAVIGYDRDAQGRTHWRIRLPGEGELEVVRGSGDDELRLDGHPLASGVIPRAFGGLLNYDHITADWDGVVPESVVSSTDPTTGWRTTRFRNHIAEIMVIEDEGGFCVEWRFVAFGEEADWGRLEPLD